MRYYYNNNTRGRANTRGGPGGRYRGRRDYESGSRGNRASSGASEDRYSEILAALETLGTTVKDIDQRLLKLEPEEPNSVKSRLGPKPLSKNYRPQPNTEGGEGGERIRSNNPSFVTMAWETADYIRLQYHMSNWEQCPKGVERAVERMVDSIHPPLAGADVKRAIQQAGEDFKTAVGVAVRAHIHSMSNLKTQNLANLSGEDQELANDTACRMVKRFLGRRISHSTMQNAILKLMDDVEHLRSRLGNTNPQPGTSGEGHKQTHGNLDSSPGSDGTAYSHHGGQAPPGKKTLLSTSDLDPDNMQIRDVEGDDGDDTVEVLANLNAQAPDDGVTVMKRPYNFPRIEPGVDTIMIFDSNGKAYQNLEFPDNIQAVGFRGAKIEDISQLLNQDDQNLALITTIVIAVGVNNRLDPSLDRALQGMQDIQRWGNLQNKRIVWVGVPDYPELAPLANANLAGLNKMAVDIFQPHYVTPLSRANLCIIKGDKQHIHYSEKTADLILTQIVTFLVTTPE